jgi:maltose phosphorylase
MAGTWMSVVEGFAGMHVKDNQLKFNPFLPGQWKSYSFNITFRNALINIKVDTDGIYLSNKSDAAISIDIFDEAYDIKPGTHIFAEHREQV